jgi:hypothetical protein
MTPTQGSLFTDPKPLSPSQAECLEALRWLVAPGVTHDIQRALAEHGISRERNCLAKRLTELERLGRVERVGKAFGGRPRTTWRRL